MSDDDTAKPEEPANIDLSEIEVVRRDNARGDSFDPNPELPPRPTKTAPERQADRKLVLGGPEPMLRSGGDWALDVPDKVPAIWGKEDEVLMARGESLWLDAPTGVGKTTLAQRLTRALLGLDGGEVLGYPVTPTDRPVVYLAADRPRQAQRSLKRMTTEADRAKLNELLYVHAGPLPFQITPDPKQLAAWAANLDAGTLIVDSLGHVAVDLAKDETGSRVNAAFGHVIAADIELVVLHHQRKAGRGDKHPKTIDDVYGSQWFTAGAGSVFYLEGMANDPIFQMKHFKSPAGEVGPLTVTIDHQSGEIGLQRDGGDDLLLYLRDSNRGLTVAQAAELVYGANPRPADKEKIRRKLDKYVPKLAHKEGGVKGGASGGVPTRYFAITPEPGPPLRGL